MNKIFYLCDRCGKIREDGKTEWRKRSFIEMFHFFNYEYRHTTVCPDCISPEEKKEIDDFEERSYHKCMDCKRVKVGGHWLPNDSAISGEIAGKQETTGVCDECAERRR